MFFGKKPEQPKQQEPQQQEQEPQPKPSGRILLLENKDTKQEKGYFYFVTFRAGHLQVFKTPTGRKRKPEVKQDGSIKQDI